MKENKYDNPAFFEQYSKMSRSVDGLKGAGEWHEFKKNDARFQWETRARSRMWIWLALLYAIENGAESAVGVDISENMLAEARKKNGFSENQLYPSSARGH